jgi:hypothetical protein
MLCHPNRQLLTRPLLSNFVDRLFPAIPTVIPQEPAFQTRAIL